MGNPLEYNSFTLLDKNNEIIVGKNEGFKILIPKEFGNNDIKCKRMANPSEIEVCGYTGSRTIHILDIMGFINQESLLMCKNSPSVRLEASQYSLEDVILGKDEEDYGGSPTSFFFGNGCEYIRSYFTKPTGRFYLDYDFSLKVVSNSFVGNYEDIIGESKIVEI